MLIRDNILKIAKNEVGTVEDPRGSNNVKYNTEYYGREVYGADYPWCCSFIWWLFKQANASHLFYGGRKTASCTTLMEYYRGRGMTGNEPRELALAFYNWGKGEIAWHIGLVTSMDGDRFTAIEGNTAVGNDSNGGAVMERVRKVSDAICFAYPIAEPIEKINERDTVKDKKFKETSIK